MVKILLFLILHSNVREEFGDYVSVCMRKISETVITDCTDSRIKVITVILILYGDILTVHMINGLYMNVYVENDKCLMVIDKYYV